MPDGQVVLERSPAQPCLARIVALDGAGRPQVRYAGAPDHAPIARLIGEVPREQLEAAIRDRRPVLIAFLDGRVDAPVIMSLSSMQDLPGEQQHPEAVEPETEPISLEVDGEARELIEAERELVLRCGSAAIMLRADGTVRITGRDITSWARRRQRIRGGSVAIN